MASKEDINKLIHITDQIGTVVRDWFDNSSEEQKSILFKRIEVERFKLADTDPIGIMIQYLAYLKLSEMLIERDNK